MTELATFCDCTEGRLSTWDWFVGIGMRFAGKFRLGTGEQPSGRSGWFGSRKGTCFAKLALWIQN